MNSPKPGPRVTPAAPIPHPAEPAPHTPAPVHIADESVAGEEDPGASLDQGIAVPPPSPAPAKTQR